MALAVTAGSWHITLWQAKEAFDRNDARPWDMAHHHAGRTGSVFIQICFLGILMCADIYPLYDIRKRIIYLRDTLLSLEGVSVFNSVDSGE